DKYMSHSEPKELILAKQLIDVCKLDDARQLLRNFEEKGGHTLHDIVLCHFLKCKLLLWQGLYEDLVKLAEQTYKESIGLGKNLLSVDIILIIANALVESTPFMYSKTTDKLHDTIKQGEELLKSFTQESPEDYKQREAYLAYIKGCFYNRRRNPKEADLALKHLEHSLALREELGIKHEIAESLIGMAWNLSVNKGELNRALKYAERSLALAKESSNIYYIAESLNVIALVYSFKGELDRSIILFEQSLELFKELNNKTRMAGALNNLSYDYKRRDELDRALECIEQSMALHREVGRLGFLANNYDFLIQILIDMGDIKRAQISLHDLEQLNSQLKNKELNTIYLLDKALLLKTSLRARDRVKAEEIIKQFLEEEDLNYESRRGALLSLCELILIELRITNDLGVLDELNQFIARLLDIAEKSHSYSILCETLLIQAKLALISLNLEKAQRLLTQGQKIAEKYGLSLLARKISNEHDKLLKQLSMWENLKESKASLNERMEL
ncbi:hypothetical protein LCGC14_2492170, partial [marine sediment metagenome]